MALIEHFRQSFKDGEVIFAEGSVGDCAYLIEHGTIEISIQHNGSPIVLAARSAGEIFGEMAMVDNLPRSASARAVGEVELLILSKEQLKYRLESIDPVLRLVLTTILERFRETLLRLKHEISDFGISVASSDSAGAGRVDRGRKDALDRIKLEQELKRGLIGKELVLNYQPIVDIKTGTITGFEALVRWNHPSHGMLSPALFISAAEESHLVDLLGRYVISEACEALKTLAAASGSDRDLVMHVNVSPRHLLADEFVDEVVAASAAAGIAPQGLVLEITEGLLIDRPDDAMATLVRCAEHGFKISLDDFGTGYSSLSYLSQFPLSEIKIDRSFINQMFENGRSMKVLESICGLAKTLNLELVAEGIEEDTQAGTLGDMGCQYAQGYYFGRPMPLHEAVSLLKPAASKVVSG